MFRQPIPPSITPDEYPAGLEDLRNSHVLDKSLPNSLDYYKPDRFLNTHFELKAGTFDVNVYSEANQPNTTSPFEGINIDKNIVIDFNFVPKPGRHVPYEEVIQMLMNYLIAKYLPNSSQIKAIATHQFLPNGVCHIQVQGKEQEFKTSITIDQRQIIIRILQASTVKDSLSFSLAAIKLTARLIARKET